MSRIARLLLLAACVGCTSPEIIEPAVTTSSRAPIALVVNEIKVESEAAVPAEGNFKDRRRSARLVEATTAFVERRLLAGGGSGWLRALVTEASLIERPRETTGGIAGFFTSEPDADLVADIALRLIVMDELGLEKAFAELKVGRTRPVSEGLDAIERDAESEALITDLLRQLDDKLTDTIHTELPDLKAF